MPLYMQINADLSGLSRAPRCARQPAGSVRRGTREPERTPGQDGQKCKSQAKDTIDVGQTDAPMATMMLGQTDDSFKAVDSDHSKNVA